MGSITDFLENELLDHIFNAAYTAPATVYLALCTADPTDAATGASCNETANAGNYSRKAIAFGAAATRKITQNADVNFDQANANWASPITHWCILDSGTYGAGNALAYGAFGAAKTIYDLNSPTVASGEIYVEFSAGEISDYLAVALLDKVFRNQTYNKPDTWVALCTGAIVDADDGAAMDEVSTSGTAYERVQVNINGGASPTWDLSASGVVDNTHAIAFAAATASWGTVTSVAIMDSGTEDAGNVLFYDNTMTDQAVGNGDTVTFPIGDLDISMS